MQTQNVSEIARQPAVSSAKAIVAKATKEPKGPSKMELAFKLVEANFQQDEKHRLSRTEMIRKIEDDVDMANAGASTYYHTSTVKYKEKYGVQVLPALPRAAK